MATPTVCAVCARGVREVRTGESDHPRTVVLPGCRRAHLRSLRCATSPVTMTCRLCEESSAHRHHQQFSSDACLAAVQAKARATPRILRRTEGPAPAVRSPSTSATRPVPGHSTSSTLRAARPSCVEPASEARARVPTSPSPSPSSSERSRSPRADLLVQPSMALGATAY